MSRFLALLLTLTVLVAVLSSCNTSSPKEIVTDAKNRPLVASNWENAIPIQLSSTQITVDGANAATDSSEAVYIANDIIYYEAGKDFTYGEGTDADAHSQEEATSHTVIHITQPGQYVLSGTLSAGQIAIDLGEDAKENPEAVVTLILNGLDLTCSVAPAIIFYNVYECSSTDTEIATKDVDTSRAGANVIIADGSFNSINGSYVARIYRPDTVELNEAGTEVADAKKLHKYDAAFYSKMSMNVFGEEEGTGTLFIKAENEGLDSELHLTLHGGNIDIESGNDGINTNEDGVSVTTINGGNLTITVTGETGEGDGIDSNGWLVINGGKVVAAACNSSADSGIDADMGIHINGGTVIASGHMLDRVEDGGQTYAVFSFAEKQSGSTTYTLTDVDGTDVVVCSPANNFKILLVSSENLAANNYTLWKGDSETGTQLTVSAGGMTGGPGMGGDMHPGGGNTFVPEGFAPTQLPEIPEGMEFPEDKKLPEGLGHPSKDFHPQLYENGTGSLPDDIAFDPSKKIPPEDFGTPEMQPPSTGRPGRQEMELQLNAFSEVFTINQGGNFFIIFHN